MAPPTSRWPAWVEEWVLPYLDEPAMRPVLISLLGHAVVVLVPFVLAVVRTGDGWAVVGTGLAVAFSVWVVALELRHQRRPGVVMLATSVTWVGVLFFSWLADRTGVW